MIRKLLASTATKKEMEKQINKYFYEDGRYSLNDDLIILDQGVFISEHNDNYVVIKKNGRYRFEWKNKEIK